MFSLSLRLLLCLALMLNGIGTATANTRMAAMEAHGAAGMGHPSPAEPQDTLADAGDCAHHSAAAAPPQPVPHDDDGGCLQSCLAMCLHHCHAVPGLALSLALPRFAQVPARHEFTERRTPASPPPVRPPIA